MNIVNEVNFHCFLVQSKQTLRSLRCPDGNGGENLAFFEPRCDYPNTLYLSNVHVCKLSWRVEFLRKISKLEKKNLSWYVDVVAPHVVVGKEMNQKQCAASAKLLFC